MSLCRDPPGWLLGIWFRERNTHAYPGHRALAQGSQEFAHEVAHVFCGLYSLWLCPPGCPVARAWVAGVDDTDHPAYNWIRAVLCNNSGTSQGWSLVICSVCDFYGHSHQVECVQSGDLRITLLLCLLTIILLTLPICIWLWRSQVWGHDTLPDNKEHHFRLEISAKNSTEFQQGHDCFQSNKCFG